jgi:hypothetical protein
MTEHFKQLVHMYCDIDDKAKKLNKEVKELKEKQKQYTQNIMDYMSNNSIEVCNAGDYGVLTLKKTLVKGSLNKDCLRDNLRKFIDTNDIASQSSDTMAENGAEFILNNRPTEERSTLKRSSTKTG